jgi:hypothetical protein
VYKNLLFHIYVKLNVFRATQCHHQEPKTAIAASGFAQYRGRLLDVWLLDADSVQQPHVQQSSTYAKPEAAGAVLGS